MSNTLVATNIRLPKEKLLIYRQMALEMNKSLSEWINEIMENAAREAILGVKPSAVSKRKKMSWEKAPIWNYRKYEKWASSVKDGAVNHDKYIYGDPHGRGEYEW